MKPIQRTCPRLLLLTVVLAAAASVAQANILDIALLNPNPTARPGDLVFFDATITNPIDNWYQVTLDSDATYVDDPLVFDDSPFWNNWPSLMLPRDSWEDILFNIQVPSSAPAGWYSGSFEIDGTYTDYSNGDDPNYSQIVYFNVQVSNGSDDGGVTAPEPVSLLLVATGGLLLLRRRRSLG